MLGVIGTKLGMTRVFKDNGTSVPVTVIEVAKSKIVQRKTPEKDGYYAVQVNFGSKKNVSKSLEKKFKDNDAKKGYLTEFNLSEEEFNFLQDILLRHKMLLMVILLHTERQAQLDNVNSLEEYLKARKWLDIWAIRIQQFKILKLKK